MSKRKKEPPRHTPQPIIPPATTPLPPVRKASLASKFWLAFVAIGSAGGTIGLLSGGYSNFVLDTEPQVHAAAPSENESYSALPFAVENPSRFTMYDVQWSCLAEDVNLQGKPSIKLSFKNVRFRYTDRLFTIPPHQKISAYCRFDNPHLSLERSTVITMVSYSLFYGFWHRIQTDFAFTWLPNAKPPRWEAGRFAN
jgi:hypothetical protein